MNLQLAFRPDAEREFFEAITWYVSTKDDVLSVISVFNGSRPPAELRRKLR